jgi:hypothetical protein
VVLLLLLLLLLLSTSLNHRVLYQKCNTLQDGQELSWIQTQTVLFKEHR